MVTSNSSGTTENQALPHNFASPMLPHQMLLHWLRLRSVVAPYFSMVFCSTWSQGAGAQSDLSQLADETSTLLRIMLLGSSAVCSTGSPLDLPLWHSSCQAVDGSSRGWWFLFRRSVVWSRGSRDSQSACRLMESLCRLSLRERNESCVPDGEATFASQTPFEFYTESSGLTQPVMESGDLWSQSQIGVKSVSEYSMTARR